MTTPPDSTDRISPGEPLIEGRPGPPKAPAGEFESLMQGSEGLQKGMTAPPPGLSPAQVPEVPQTTQSAQPSIDSILSQVGMTQDSLGNLQNQLNTKNLKLTNSQKNLLRNKLSNSTTHLRAVNETLGVQPPAAPAVDSGAGPVAKLIGYVTDGESQMKAAQAKLGEMQTTKDALNPAELLLIQVKLNQAQQEIDYSTLLISKAVTALTQLLNTQL